MRDSGSNGKRKRILLVDDSADLRAVYELALHEEGYEVKGARDGEEALAVCHTWRPDLIITDIFMPGMNGFELITHVRSDFVPPVPAVVAVSGFPDARDEALRRGAIYFAMKPLSLDELLDAVGLGLSIAEPMRPPEAEAKRREDTRAAARASSQALLDVLLERTRAPLDGMTRGAHAMSRFFGHSTTLVFLLRGGALTVAASSNPEAYPLGAEATDLLSLANDVLDSGSTIVLPNIDAQALLQRTSESVRFFVGVPYVLDGRPVGVMCLVDDSAHDFTSPELALLEYTASRFSARFSGALSQPMVGPSGLPTRGPFESLLAFALQWAAQNGKAVGVELVASTVPPPEASCVSVFDELPAPRMLMGLIDQHRIATFCAGASVDAVRAQLSAVRGALGEILELGASAEVTFEAPIPQIAPALVLRWADDILGRAMTTGKPALESRLNWINR